MGFKGTKTIGRPGPAKKFKIPPGFRMFSYHGIRQTGLSLSQIGYEGQTGSELITLSNNPNNYEPGDVTAHIYKMYAKEASRNWSAAGSNPRMHAALNVTGYWTPEYSLQVEDSYLESASCDSADLNISEVEIKGSRVITNEEIGFNGPVLRIRVTPIDMPGSRSMCVRSYDIRATFLIKSSLIVNVNFSNPNHIITEIEL